MLPGRLGICQFNSENQTKIVEAGALEPLVNLLPDMAKEYAA